MIVAAQQGKLCYDRHRIPCAILRRSSCGATNGTARIRPGFSPAACDATPHPRTFRAILNCGLGDCASHGRTDRPSPHPRVRAWQGWRFALPLHPSRAGVSHPMHPCGEPSRSLRPIDRGFAPGPHQGESPLEPDGGLSHPSTTRRRLSRPGTHDQSLRALDNAQAAFMPLHPDEGAAPLDPLAGARSG